MDDELDSSSPASGRCSTAFSTIFASVLHGLGSGLIGIFIALLIRNVQIFGFGYDNGGFLDIASEAPQWRRMLCVTGGGLFGAVTWYWLRGRPTHIVSVDQSLQGAKMPPVITILNAMIQDIVVALGGSFGREAAPREIAAMWGGVVADSMGMDSQGRKVMVACGAGAGLAAVYSVPISGALYTIEHVLNWDLSLGTLVPAIITSCVATAVTSHVVEAEGLYSMPCYSYDWPSLAMLLWAALVGPLAGLSAACFRRGVKFVEAYKPVGRAPALFEETKRGDYVWLTREIDGYLMRTEMMVVRKDARGVVLQSLSDYKEETLDESAWQDEQPECDRDWTILLVMPAASLALAILCDDFPSLLGNGRAVAEIAIERKDSLGYFVTLLFLKATITAAAIGSGAAGGTLTPSVALGATIGAVVGETYQWMCPSLAPTQDAPMSVIAAAAFLAVGMRAPWTGIWLLVEFSAQGVRRQDLLAALHCDFDGLVKSKAALGMLLPMALAVVGATAAVSAAGWLWDWLGWPQPEDLLRTLRAQAESADSLQVLELAELSTQASLQCHSPPSKRVRSSSFSDDDDTDSPKRPSQRLTLPHSPFTVAGRSFSCSSDLDLLREYQSEPTHTRTIGKFNTPGSKSDSYLPAIVGSVWPLHSRLEDQRKSSQLNQLCFRAGLFLGTFITISITVGVLVCPDKVALVATASIPVAALLAALQWGCCQETPTSTRSGWHAMVPAKDGSNGETEFKHEGAERSQSCKGFVCPMLLAMLGAAIPTMPWTFDVGQERIVGLVSSCASSFLAAGCGALAFSRSVPAVAREMLLALLASGAAAAAGWAWQHWGGWGQKDCAWPS
eukprot:TRINITY_DN88337_c0_g1_i1.p1 TRINITY_DN88337_c0_g1~~TRINITY_DN88337_c0_g1_i1.p1  ORF type:complete len:843 (-),score=124.95 TRINITY_DN88337_c0_g1_i1:73-2601(-)